MFEKSSPLSRKLKNKSGWHVETFKKELHSNEGLTLEFSFDFYEHIVDLLKESWTKVSIEWKYSGGLYVDSLHITVWLERKVHRNILSKKIVRISQRDGSVDWAHAWHAESQLSLSLHEWPTLHNMELRVASENHQVWPPTQTYMYWHTKKEKGVRGKEKGREEEKRGRRNKWEEKLDNKRKGTKDLEQVLKHLPCTRQSSPIQSPLWPVASTNSEPCWTVRS